MTYFPPTEYRLPFEPLQRTAQGDRPWHDPDGCSCSDTQGSYCYSDQDFAEALGVSYRTVARWRQAGGIPIERADELAVRLGRLPDYVWGEEWESWADGHAELLDA